MTVTAGAPGGASTASSAPPPPLPPAAPGPVSGSSHSGPGANGAASASSPPTSSGGGGGLPSGAGAGTRQTHVSESAYEFLLGEILHWIEEECKSPPPQPPNSSTPASSSSVGGGGEEGDPSAGIGGQREHPPPAAAQEDSAQSREERVILSAERAAAKIERLGFDVGYRLCERLAQHKPLGPPIPPAGSSAAAKDSTSSGTDTAAASQLEAVKFLCKEFWTEVFRKQIDKLQTNHRGVFVLKDHELRWLRRLPPEDETARVAAIKMLAFPCGLIRGALGNLGIAAVVSCDFLADGKNMAACSFNIKVKS